MMSQSSYLADLEARVLANTAKIQCLNATNTQLALQNEQQEDLIAKYQAEINLNDKNTSMLRLPLESSAHVHPGLHPTPFYIQARTAPQLQLSFVVQGMQGETLNFAVRSDDLAFLLKETLKSQGWGDAMVQRSVLEFLDVPMVMVSWRGKGGEIGVLNNT
jgi:hypothetical protein